MNTLLVGRLRRRKTAGIRKSLRAKRGYVSDMVTIDDAALLRAMFYVWERLKLVVEPTGALAAAAALEGRVQVAGKRVGIILSGGNADLSQISKWIALQ